MKNPLLYRSAQAQGERTRARGSLWRRSFELKASDAVGLRWEAVFGCQVVWNRSTRRAGVRGGPRVGRPRWLLSVATLGASAAVNRLGTIRVKQLRSVPLLPQPY